jgi:hypothetical protein
MLLAELLDLMPGLVARTGMHNAVMARLKYLRNLFEIPAVSPRSASFTSMSTDETSAWLTASAICR